MKRDQVRADILLAEDNPSDAELILQVLGEVAPVSRVHRVQDGVEALEYLRTRSASPGSGVPGPLHLVFLDVKMPRVGGLEVLRAIRSDPATRHVPVVMLTSSNIQSDVREAYQLGANAYVQKPVDFLRFRDVVRLMGRFWAEINEVPAPGSPSVP